MKQLYKTILEILKEIPQVKWADFNAGQLEVEMPPVAFPVVLISIGNIKCEDGGGASQRVYASFSLTLAQPLLGQTCANAPEPMQSQALSFLDLAEEIYKKMQNYQSPYFYPFERTAIQMRQFKGLNAVELHFETAWQDDSANS